MHPVYVILMRRWGDTEKHSYLGGVYPEFIEHNPAGAFKASGTMVSTVTVVLDKAA